MTPNTTPSSNQNLTPREVETLTLLAEGLSNRKIAKRLGISPHTAKFHVNGILKKLDADNRLQATMKAVQRGLLSLPKPDMLADANA